jgi:hypothetical protein
MNIKKAKKKEYYLNNKEKLLEQRKEYYLNNKEKLLEQRKEYYLNNKEYQKEYQKEYRLNNKEKILEQTKKYYLNNKEKKKEYQLNNKEKIKERKKEHYLNNKEKILAQQKEYQLNNKGKIKEYQLKNKEKIKERKKKYHLNNKEKTNNRKKNRYRTDPNFRIVQCLRARLTIAIKGTSKSKATLTLLGCTIEQLWVHLEKQFQPWMTRANHGLWHIDHIIPCASFDLTDPKQQAECFHYTNLQPLWAHQNISKGAKYDATL